VLWVSLMQATKLTQAKKLTTKHIIQSLHIRDYLRSVKGTHPPGVAQKVDFWRDGELLGSDTSAGNLS
jgi:hypothetical protein